MTASSSGNAPTRPEPLKIAVAGAKGRMGRAVLAVAAQCDDVRVVAASLRPADPDVGKPVPGHPHLTYAGQAEALFSEEAIVIDFTTPQATRHHLALARDAGRPLVIGTTGLDAEDEQYLAAAATAVPVLRAANFSMGVTLLGHLLRTAARALGSRAEIEILDIHHGAKRDAPSGTALALARAAAEARGQEPEAVITGPRWGLGEGRAGREIGIAALRGGDVVGEHTAFLLMPGERLELTHRAGDRGIFARGAIAAARWLAGRPPGLYDMEDVLGLKTS